jgi:flagellar motor switch/type III secretory pathway protein FliN
MDATELARFIDIPLEVEAVVEGRRLSVRDLLALKAGSVIETQLPAGENVNVHAGQSPLGLGELTASRGKIVVRLLRFRGDK